MALSCDKVIERRICKITRIADDHRNEMRYRKPRHKLTNLRYNFICSAENYASFHKVTFHYYKIFITFLQATLNVQITQ